MQAIPLTVAAAGASLLFAADPGPGSPTDPPRFAKPVRLEAGDKFMGEGRLYPSPVVRDMNGDGRADVVLGDLIGKVTVAHRETGDSIAFGSDKPLKDRSGEQLRFHNW